MKRAQKNFERAPRKKNFCERNPRLVKARNCEQSSQFNKKQQNRAKKKKVGKFDETRPKKIWARSEKNFFLRAKPYRLVKAKNHEQSS